MRCTRRHTAVSSQVYHDEDKDQILSTFIVWAGLSWGDSYLSALLRIIGLGSGRATSQSNALPQPRSPLRTFDAIMTCRETGCWQQECELGMTELSQWLAIFTQQLCSSSVMARPGVTHAARGSPKSTGIRTSATNFEPLLNIVILPHRVQWGCYHCWWPLPARIPPGEQPLYAVGVTESHCCSCSAAFGHIFVQHHRCSALCLRPRAGHHRSKHE